MSAALPKDVFRAQLVIAEQRELYDYWLNRSGDRAMPARSDISPADFPRLLPGISLIEVSQPENRFRVRLAGTRLREVYEQEITGLYLDELDWGDRHDYWMSAYERVAGTGMPAQGVVRGPRVTKEHLVQFWIRLPLSSAPPDVQMILCYDAFVPALDLGEEPQALGASDEIYSMTAARG